MAPVRSLHSGLFIVFVILLFFFLLLLFRYFLLPWLPYGVCTAACSSSLSFSCSFSCSSFFDISFSHGSRTEFAQRPVHRLCHSLVLFLAPPFSIFPSPMAPVRSLHSGLFIVFVILLFFFLLL